MLVSKLKGARDRKRALTGKCGGRVTYAKQSAEMVALAKKLARYPVNGLCAELEAQGYVNAEHKRFQVAAIMRMIAAFPSHTTAQAAKEKVCHAE